MTTWCRFEKDGQASFGLVEGDRVIAVEDSPFADYKRTGRVVALSAVKR